jgi:hypothetical protein
MSMTLEQLAAEVRELKKQAAAGQRARDELDIHKVQSLYSHYYQIGRRGDVPSLFAQHTPGVTLEIEDSGIYDGIAGVTRFWNDVFGGNNPLPVGWLSVHMTCNPIIEINKDGTRAKGVWHSHGFCALHGVPLLCCGKYDMEYVKEDGAWKILVFRYRQIFMSPYEQGWVKAPSVGSIAANPKSSPDRPTTFHTPYDPAAVNTCPPPPPSPYAD